MRDLFQMQLLTLLLCAASAVQAHEPLLTPPPAAPPNLHSWTEALRMVRQYAPRYQRAGKRVRARAQSQLALASVLPSLNAEGGYTRQFVTERVMFGAVSFETPVPNVGSGGATLSWQLGNVRGYYSIGTANLNIAANERDFVEQRRLIASSVMEAVLATLVTARVAALDRVGLRAALDREQLAHKRLQYGQGKTLDIDRATQRAGHVLSLAECQY